MASLYDSNPFEVLGLKPGADAQDVRAAYRRLVKSCHPDQFQDPQLKNLAAAVAQHHRQQFDALCAFLNGCQ